MTNFYEKHSKAIWTILLIMFAGWPMVVAPLFYGASFSWALSLTAFWIFCMVSASPFIIILGGFIMVFLAMFAGVNLHTDTAEASIQRARLEARGYTIQYYKPVKVGNYDPTWDQKRPYYLSNYPSR